MLTCVENILNNIGQGDCLTCICDVYYARKITKDEEKEEKSHETSCNFLACGGSVLGEYNRLIMSFVLKCFVLGAVETCLDAGSAEEVIECARNILDIIPHSWQEKMMVPAKYQKISHNEGKTKIERSCSFPLQVECTTVI